MKQYKLISLDEYDKYIRWKNEGSGSYNQEISKSQDTSTEENSKSLDTSNNSKSLDTSNTIKLDENIGGLVDPEFNVITSNSTSNDENRNLVLVPPGKPDIEKINNKKYIDFINYEPNREWKRQWRKSIR